MLKRLLLLSGAALLTYHSSAQTFATPEIRLPGEVPGLTKPTATAGRISTVSQLQELLFQNWDGSAWVDFQRQTYPRYVTPTLPGTIATDRKNGAAWVPNFAHRYRYTTAGEILSDTIDQYQVAPYGAYYATINTFNNPSQVRWEWEKISNPTQTPAFWDSIRRTAHTYNAAGQRTQIVEEMFTNGVLSPIARRLFTYNSLGQIAVREAQSIGTTGWEPFQRFNFTYNAAGRPLQAITENVVPGSNTFYNSARDTYSFDGQGRESMLTSETWGTTSWEPASQVLYTYTAAGDLGTATLQAWNPGSSTYQNYRRIVLTYKQVTAAQRTQNAALCLAVAPNPGSAAEAALYYRLPAAAPVAVDVCDLMGRRVATALAPETQAAGSHRVPLAGLALAPGLYVLRLHAGPQQWQVKWDNR